MVTIVDQGVPPSAARAATSAEVKPLTEGWIGHVGKAFTGPGESDITVVWVGSACDQSATLTIATEADHITIAPDPIGNCDLVPSYRGVVLTFSRPFIPNAIVVELKPTEVR